MLKVWSSLGQNICKFHMNRETQTRYLNQAENSGKFGQENKLWNPVSLSLLLLSLELHFWRGYCLLHYVSTLFLGFPKVS